MVSPPLYTTRTNARIRRRFWAVSIGVSLLLTSCAVYVSPDHLQVAGRYRIALGNVIRVFEPNRGQGSTYNVGEEIRFRIVTSRSGYVTLTAIDPDGFVYVLGPRNTYVDAGETILPVARDNIRFTAAPPRGFHRVRVSFTPQPTDTTVTVYRGRRGVDTWTETIVTEVERYPSDARDIAETNLFIR